MAAVLVSALKSNAIVDLPPMPVSEEQRTALMDQLSFAIFAGGFQPRDPRLDGLIKGSVPNMKTLHIIGEADVLVQPERSYALAENFPNAEILLHPGGHFVPVNADTRPVYTEFLATVPRPHNPDLNPLAP